MKTIFVNEKDQKREWFIIDASGKSLGRVASAGAGDVGNSRMAL